MAKKYIGRIKNITINQWVTDEADMAVTYDKLKKNACIFNDEADAVTTLEYLNDGLSHCFVLIDNAKKV